MSKFLKFDPIDFAQEPSFIHWVKKIHEDDVAFWEEWTAKHPEKKTQIAEAKALVLQLSFKESTIDPNAEERVWSKINADIGSSTKLEKPDKKKGRLVRMLTLSAAAATIIFLFMIRAGSGLDTEIQTQYADIQRIELPDGSLVHVNSDSKMSYDKKTWSSNRQIELDGEAFFEVKKGASFVVKTKLGNVIVLGTKFNVFARGHSFDVYCESGKVAVEAANKRSVLIQNQSVRIHNNEHHFEKEINTQINRSKWQSGTYNYDNVSVGEVSKELERHLDIHISLPKELKHTLYTGSFSTKDIDNALSEVYWPLGLSYERNGTEVTISQQ